MNFLIGVSCATRLWKRRILTEPVNISGILRMHRQRAGQAAARLRKILGKMPPRRTLWRSPDGVYTIDEATDPRHLQADSSKLRHCVGTSHNSAMLAERGLRSTDPEAIHCLHYWLKVVRGSSRIFTFMRGNASIATMEVENRSGTIVQFEPRLIMEEDLAELLRGVEYLRLQLGVDPEYKPGSRGRRF